MQRRSRNDTRTHLTRALVGCFILTSACSGLDDFEHVIVDEATIPATALQTAPFALGYQGGFNNIDLSKAETFQNNDVEPNDVDAIFVKSIHLEGTKEMDRLEPFLKSISLWVEAPGLTRVVIASQDQFTVGSRETDIPIADPNFNLKPYATAESMSVGTDVEIKQRPPFGITLKTTITLLIDINLPL